MDKVEYRELIRNIKNKYLQKDYEGVIEIADQLDPQKIRENSILEILAKAYESVGRSDLARNVLLVAYKRTPTGKRIAYNLAMLSIKLDDLDSAVMFYEDFCKMAPKDNQKLLLKYEIGKAGGIPVSDLARVLETYNAREMDDKWEYELARLYHEMGDGEKCAATCDQIILWYANGDYEKKALELKNMHKALTPAQQARYEEIMKEVMYYPHKEPAADEEKTEEESGVIETGEVKEEQTAPETEEAVTEETTAEPEAEETADEPEEETAADPETEEPVEEAGQSEEPAEVPLPEIDYQTTHLAPQGFTEETEIEDEENIAGQLSLSAMFDAFRNQTIEDREQMNKVGEDRAAQILAEVNDTHDSSILEQFTTEEDENEPVDEIFEPEIPLLNREDMIEPVDDGGEDLGERAAEFAFEKKDAEEEPKPVDRKESSVDATQFIPVNEITAQIAEETIEELSDDEQIPPSMVGETSVYEEIDPGSAAGKVVVGSAVENETEEEPASDIPVSEEPLPVEEPVPAESVQEESVQEEPVKEEPVPAEPVQEKEPEKEFVLDLIFGNSEIPKRKKKVRVPEPVVEPVQERSIPTVEPVPEEVITEAVNAAEDIATEAPAAVEETVVEVAETVEEAAEPVEDAWDAAIDAMKAEEEAAKEAAEETEEAVSEAAEEVVETIPRGDLFVPRSRAQKSNALNRGSNIRSAFKKKESEEDAKAREERARAEKARKAKARSQKEKLREEKQKERSLRREMQQEERLHKEELRVEKLREEQQRKKKLWEEQEKERLLKEQLSQEQLQEEPQQEEPLPEEPQQIPEEQVREEKHSKETTSLLQKASGIGALFGSLFKRKEVQRKRRVESEEETSIFDELTETALAAEEAKAAERAAAEKAAPKEDWEDAAEAAAAETIEKLKEFVAMEEPGSEEPEQEEKLPEDEETVESEEPEESEEPAEEEEPEEGEEPEEEEEPEEDGESEEEEETAEEEEEPIPVLKKPEKNPEADAAAAAALELYKQLSVKEKEDKEQKKATAKAEAEAEIEIEAEIEAKEKARAIAEELFSSGNFVEVEEEPVPEEPKPLRGNKVYRGNKNNNKKKKDKNRKRSARVEDELYAEIEASEKKGKKMNNNKINLDELLDETLQPGKQVNKTPINQESLDQLLNATIDFSKSEEVQPKVEAKPERELTVSQSGEFDLEGFIQQDNRKEDSRQMSFDELFGGEFRPKVRIPAEASTKSQTRKLVLNKKYKLSREQRRALGEFLIVDGMEEEICSAIDNLVTKKKSGDETGGHMIVTGDAKSGKTYLTIEILKAVNQEVGHGNPRVAKVQAQAINGKNIRKVLSKVTDSDLIIENIGKLEDATVRDIITAVRENDASTMVILEGNELAADTLIQEFPDLSKVFKTRVDIGELTITQWGDIAQKYAESQGYSIDGTALLALKAKIDQINTPDTKLGFDQIRRIVDDAIDKAERRGSGKLFSAFAGKADDSLIALTEESFM